MKIYSARVGSVIFFRNWLWVFDRRINDCWRLRALISGQYALIPISTLSALFLTKHMSVVTEPSDRSFHDLSPKEIRHRMKTLKLDGG